MRYLLPALLITSSLQCLAKEVNIVSSFQSMAEKEGGVDTSGYEIYLIENANAVVIDANNSTHVSELENSITVMDLCFSTKKNYIFSTEPDFRLWDTETGVEQNVREFLLRLVLD